MKIHLATDHAGFEHKEAVKAFLLEQELEVIDHGASAFISEDDYPDYIALAAVAVGQDPESFGIIFGGSGQAEAMVANRMHGVRCAVYYGGVIPTDSIDVDGAISDDPNEILKLTREHNAANMLSIGARFVSIDDAIGAVRLWLETPFSGDERHIRRLNKF